MRKILFLSVLILLIPCTAAVQEVLSYKVLDTVDHDKTYFTQGLEVSDGLMFESAGRYGESRVRKYRPAGDSTLLEQSIAKEYFAEGLTLFKDELFLLTWQKETLFVFDPDTLKVKRELTYNGEGWGLASNGTQLIMSDGSDKIYFRNPETFEVEREIQVTSGSNSVHRINELEFAQGFIWANIWRAPVIVKISPLSGKVSGYYDFSELVSKHSTGNDESVLNGIAYDSDHNAFWVTGKLWPRRYLVKLD